MTKGELLKFLEPFTDEVEIFVNVGQDKNNLTNVEPIEYALYYQDTTGRGEVWLNLQAPIARRK